MSCSDLGYVTLLQEVSRRWEGIERTRLKWWVVGEPESGWMYRRQVGGITLVRKPLIGTKRRRLAKDRVVRLRIPGRGK